jgi:non-heme chloroperoxidase
MARSRSGHLLKVAGLTAGVVAGLAGVAYGAERVALRRIRRRADPDTDRGFAVPPGETRTIPSFDGGELAVLSRGEGPLVVLSHGVTESIRVWVRQLESLPAEGLRVVAFDHRGHGGSLPGAAGHSVANLAEDVRAVLEQLDLRDAVLVGHSMGGVAVQAFAVMFPEVAAERVRGLVLLTTLAKVRLGNARRLRCAAERAFQRGPDVGSIMSRPEIGFLLARVAFGRDPVPSQVELTRQMLAECPRDTAFAATAALLGLDLTGDLPSITIPTLVIGGTADLLTPPAESRRIASLIPGARLELMEGGGHMLMLERADEVNRLIADFARDVGAELVGTT